MLQLGLADECCEAIHVRLAILSVLSAYNVSSQLVSSIKGIFRESKHKEGQHGISILA